MTGRIQARKMLAPINVGKIIARRIASPPAKN